MPAAGNMCAHCKVRPRWGTQLYCSQACDTAAQAAASQAAVGLQAGLGAPPSFVSPRPSPPPGMCKFCQSRPGVNDGRVIHPYCGQACHQQAIAAGWSEAGFPPGAPQAAVQAHPLPGVGGPVAVAATVAPVAGQVAVVAPFGQPHPAAAPGMCKFCTVRPAYQGHSWCGKSCAGKARAAGWQGDSPPPASLSPMPGSPSLPVALPFTTSPQMNQPAAPPGAPGVPINTALSPVAVVTPVAAAGMCKFCTARPAFQGHPYCGKGCGGKAKAAGWVDGNPPGMAPEPAPTGAPATPHGLCHLCACIGSPCLRNCVHGASIGPATACHGLCLNCGVAPALGPAPSGYCPFCRKRACFAGHPYHLPNIMIVIRTLD
jgi:hypothetical protein